jgi:hypothetical protein
MLKSRILMGYGSEFQLRKPIVKMPHMQNPIAFSLYLTAKSVGIATELFT